MRPLSSMSLLLALSFAPGCRPVGCSLSSGQRLELLRRGVQDLRADIRTAVRRGDVAGPVSLDANCCSLISRRSRPSVADVTKTDNDVGYIVQVGWSSRATGMPALKRIEYDDCGSELRRTGV